MSYLLPKRRAVVVAWAVALSLVYPAPTATGQDATGEGNCRFPDVPAASPVHADITYACRQGWLTGYPDGSFRPDRPVPAHQIATVVGRAFPSGSTRADMASFLRGGNPGDPATPARFPDVPATHPQNVDIAYAVEQSWFQGYPDDTFRPDQVITATQITTVLQRTFPTASTRAQLAAFMRNGQQALPWTSKIAYDAPVYNSLGNVAARELRVVGVGGPGSRQLSGDVEGWEWSPDGERVAYEVIVRDSRGSPTGYELWVAGEDGSGARQITDYSGGYIRSPSGDGEHPRPESSLRRQHSSGGNSWSPSGELIAYWKESSGLWVIGADGLGARRLSGDVSGYSWSPDGERISYSTASGELWVVGVNGSGARQLTDDWISFSWSPDGEWIAYSSGVWEFGERVGYDLWVAEADGSSVRQHPDNVRDWGWDWSWSPDGERIAYKTDGGELWVAGAEGSSTRRLTDYSVLDSEWSPDGERIAYRTNISTGRELWVVGVDGSGARQLTDDVRRWKWSPDGEQIAYRRYGGKLWVAAADGSGARWLADDVRDRGWGQFGGEWEWSPDGERIVYETDSGELWLAGVDGSGTRQVADDFSGWEWSSDGERIAYDTENNGLWLVGVDGSGVRQLTNYVVDWDWQWEWQPGGS